MQRGLFLILLLGLALPASASSELKIDPFIEALVVVRDGDAVTELFTDQLGWRQRVNTSVDRQQLNAWQLSPLVSAQQWLLTAPGAERGHLRIIQFRGTEQSPIRPADQPWDTGGLFDVNVHTDDIDTLFRLLTEAGWHAVSEPERLRLPEAERIKWLPRSPDGMRISPVQDAAPLSGRTLISGAFNATQIVADIDAAAAFYRNVLGFEPIRESHDIQLQAGPNIYGLPYNLLEELHLSIVTLGSGDSREGTLELVSLAGADGRDFAERARPPNLGMLGLRFPVNDLGALKNRLEEHDIAIQAGPTTVAIQPHGLVEVLAIHGPGGIWLEFYE